MRLTLLAVVIFGCLFVCPFAEQRPSECGATASGGCTTSATSSTTGFAVGAATAACTSTSTSSCPHPESQGKEASAVVPFTGVPGTATERSFLALKPDGVQRAVLGEVVSRFERKGWKLVGLKMVSATRSLVESHYEEHAGKPFFDKLVNYLCSGPLVAMVWEGPNVISGVRKMLGSTRPLEAEVGTIRGDLGITAGRNLLHASDSPESAAREIALWFTASEVVQWSRSIDPWVSHDL